MTKEQINCPKCGAEPTNDDHDSWECGTYLDMEGICQSFLCEEREEHNATKAKLVACVEALESVFYSRADLTQEDTLKICEAWERATESI